MSAGDLLVDLCRIQQATGTKRTALVAEAKAKWAGAKWSSDELTAWARWVWMEGTKQ